jgi:hypothetical protein
MPALEYWDVAQNQYILLTPGATTFPFTYMQTLSTPSPATSPYQINHNLNTTTPIVQIWDAVTGQNVLALITVVNANSITVAVQQAMPNNVNVIIMGSAQAPVPVAPANYATMQFVTGCTAQLPPPVTTTTVQSFTDVLGDIWIAKSTVSSGAWRRARDVAHARIYLNTATVTTGGGIAMTGTTNDPFSCCAGGIFYCPIAGVYKVTVSLGLSTAPTAAGFVQPAIVVTGNLTAYGPPNYYPASSAALPGGICSDFVVCLNTDNIQAYTWVSQSCTLNGNTQRSYMSVEYVGPSS